jgi:plasmid stabilization system protein ParE
MRLRLTPQAAEELAAVGDYIRTHNPAAAAKVRAAIVASLRTLTRFPFAGRRQTVEGVRKIVTRRYPYLVYYTVDEVGQAVVVLSIRHPSRQREYADL